MRTGHIHEHATESAFLMHGASCSLPQPIVTCFTSGYGTQSRGTLVTRPLNDVEEGSILLGRVQQFVIATNFINGRLREGHPPRAAPTEQPLMQTTVVKRHRTYLSGFLWLHIDCFLENYGTNIDKFLYSFNIIIYICLIETFLHFEVPKKSEAVQRMKRPVTLGLSLSEVGNSLSF
jgi:hypothetical protein